MSASRTNTLKMGAKLISRSLHLTYQSLIFEIEILPTIQCFFSTTSSPELFQTKLIGRYINVPDSLQCVHALEVIV